MMAVLSPAVEEAIALAIAGLAFLYLARGALRRVRRFLSAARGAPGSAGCGGGCAGGGHSGRAGRRVEFVKLPPRREEISPPAPPEPDPASGPSSPPPAGNHPR
jgi:hypothetical protein